MSEPKNQEPNFIVAGRKRRTLNVHPDLPDLRDRMYEPALLPLQIKKDPPPQDEMTILDQGVEGACTGFALAAVINLQNSSRIKLQRTKASRQVSPRMLYEMARIHDEWPGETYDGSSIRGAVKGFFHNGVCSLEMAPYKPAQKDWNLSVDQAKDARRIGLGAYYRLRPQINDYHVALNEVGAIIASARVHRGWSNPKRGRIKKSTLHEGGHAFAIIGYDESGFLILNSWGDNWGGFNKRPGIAHWSYQDWAENIIDAWVLRLSVPTPDAFDLTHIPIGKDTATSAMVFERPEPRRNEVLGHFIHLDDGKLVEKGRYGTNLESIRETARLIKERADVVERKYRHLVFYAHGGLNSEAASARRINAMRDAYKRNGIYPVHFMWETGFTEELADVMNEVFQRSQERVGFGRDALNWAVEKFSRGIGRKVWRQMKFDAVRAFQAKGGGFASVRTILQANASARHPLSVHLVGHSAGSILLAELVEALSRMGRGDLKIESCSLMAPACTIDLYERTYRPALKTSGSVRKLLQYNLVDDREQSDTVGPYGNSLLYLVSRAFEDADEAPLLGMAIHSEKLKTPRNHLIWYAGRNRSRTDSNEHGGFDNDRLTMNDVLANILGKKPQRSKAFQEHELQGY